MSSERIWIVILTIAAFCAGMAGGILLIQETAPELRTAPGAGARAEGSVPGAFVPYRDQLIDAFDLDSARSRDLEAALREYAEQIDILRERSLRGMEPELIRAGEDCFLKIREYIIPPDRRPEFDKLVAGNGGSSLPDPLNDDRSEPSAPAVQ